MNTLTKVLLPAFLATHIFSSNYSTFADSAETKSSIDSPTEAVNRLLLYTGFDDLKGVTGKAAAGMTSVYTVKDDDTPFLCDSVIGTRVWEIRIPVVTLKSSQEPDIGSRRFTEFVAIVDSVKGTLFRITASSGTKDSNVNPEPDADMATIELRSGSERYYTFLSEPPLVSFEEALIAAGPCNPFPAHEILAYPIMYSYIDTIPRPVWCIVVRGTTTYTMLKYPHHQHPECLLNRQRCIIDAKTGKPLWMFTNSPSYIPLDSL